MITIALTVRLACSYCGRGRMWDRVDCLPEGGAVAERVATMTALLEAKAVKKGWTCQPYTESSREWRCKTCTDLLALRLATP